MSLAADALDEVLRAYERNGSLGDTVILDRSAALWSEIQPRTLSQEEQIQAGEVFRRAAISAVKTQSPDAAVWRSRGLAMFALAGSSNGVAMLVLASALGQLSEGRKAEALQQIDLMHLLVDEQETVISAATVQSAAFENEAIVRLDPGEDGPDPAGARAALEQALPFEEAAGDHRRVLKLRASIASADYLEARSAPDGANAIAAAQDALRSLVDKARGEGIAQDVVETAERNLQLMDDVADQLEPYQVI